jgi:hypothetical protein
LKSYAQPLILLLFTVAGIAFGVLQINSISSYALKATVGLFLGGSIGVLTFLDRTNVLITKVVAGLSSVLVVLGGTIFALASVSATFGAWFVFVCCGVGLYLLLTPEA